jgi:acyl dehydratase
MLALFGRAGLAMIPGASRLPFVGGGGDDVPDLTLLLGEVSVDRERLLDYDRVCGFTLGDQLPATYPHMLAFPLHLALMADGSFPFSAIGLVHIYNRIVQHRRLQASELLSLRVWAEPLRPHPRGQQFSILTEARVGDELVWEEVSTNLRRGSGGASADAGAPKIPSASELAATATWKLAGDLGRRYGSVSGDLNPIHIHPLTARLFGFPSAIAHGMWTKARSLAALQPQLPDAFAVEVAFRKPILLPASVEFAEAASEAGVQFGVRDARKRTQHLDGTLTFG